MSIFLRRIPIALVVTCLNVCFCSDIVEEQRIAFDMARLKLDTLREVSVACVVASVRPNKIRGYREPLETVVADGHFQEKSTITAAGECSLIEIVIGPFKEKTWKYNWEMRGYNAKGEDRWGFSPFSRGGMAIICYRLDVTTSEPIISGKPGIAYVLPKGWENSVGAAIQAVEESAKNKDTAIRAKELLDSKNPLVITAGLQAVSHNLDLAREAMDRIPTWDASLQLVAMVVLGTSTEPKVAELMHARLKTATTSAMKPEDLHTAVLVCNNSQDKALRMHLIELLKNFPKSSEQAELLQLMGHTR